MNNHPDINELIDKAAAGRLTPDEEIRWNALLAERPELEEDLAIGRAIQAMPPPPAVSSNFTSLVLQQIRREEKSARRPAPWFVWPRFARVLTLAAVAIAATFGALQWRHKLEMETTAEQFAWSVSRVAQESNGARPETVVSVFRDFKAIRNLPDPSNDIDYSLLAALDSK